jgi:hypothetical protein
VEFEFLGFSGREFAQNVPFGGLGLMSVEVIQVSASMLVVKQAITTFLTACRTAFRFAGVLHRLAKANTGAVEQNSQVRAVNLKFAADRIFIFFVETDALDEPAVFLGHLIENAGYKTAALRRSRERFRAAGGIFGLGSVFGHLAVPRE